MQGPDDMTELSGRESLTMPLAMFTVFSFQIAHTMRTPACPDRRASQCHPAKERGLPNSPVTNGRQHRQTRNLLSLLVLLPNKEAEPPDRASAGTDVRPHCPSLSSNLLHAVRCLFMETSRYPETILTLLPLFRKHATFVARQS